MTGLVFVLCGAGSSRAQDPPRSERRPYTESAGGPAAKSSSDAKTAEPVGKLDESEAGLSRRYSQFERTLIQMAEYLRKAEPERAELLIRTIGKSREERIIQQMDQVTELLKTDQLGDAVGREEHLVTNLKALLELLQSEDRRHQLEEEKKWLESLRKEVEKLSAREKELRKATETKGVGAGKGLTERQQGIGRDTNSLLEKINKQDAARNGSQNQPPSGKKNSSGNSPEKDHQKNDQNGKPDNKSARDSQKDGSKQGESGEKRQSKRPESQKQGAQKQDVKDAGKKKTDSQRDDSKQKDAKKDDSKGGASAPKGSQQQGSKQQDSKNQGNGQQNKPQGKGEDSPEGEAQPQEGSENDSPDEKRIPQKTPGREEIEQARRAMRQAEDELKRLRNEKALPREEEAIRKLADAKAQLEKILRQLREEEQEIMLRSLEARFAKMLVMQLQVQFDTVTLAKTEKKAWTTRHFGRSRELSVTEDAIAEEARKALALLKEEGSSVAFPQGVEQVREDMLTIARRLEKNDVGELTQTIEKETIESLEELLASLQSEIENRKKPENQRQRRQGSGRQHQDDSLVKNLAELKMLRSLQLRVNRRTKLIGRMIKGEQAANEELVDQLQKLARRQEEIQEATYILASGRNR